MKKTAILAAGWLILTGFSLSDQKPGSISINPNLFQPTIQSVIQRPGHGAPKDELNIKGKFFGKAAGMREIHLGNQVLETAVWETQTVYTFVPWSVTFGKKYPICIWDKTANKAVSNTVEHILLMTAYFPEQANAMSPITINTYQENIGDKGTRKVKFGNTAANILSWDIHSFSVIVPNLYPGVYESYVEDNGEAVSYKFQVMILPQLVK